ncbi:hypothetical protein FN846DRAFT_906932 [Sphaerosporella brunnea]|uniref:C2H2-domain containing protein second zinc finger domain-containing protein n=1 Tax=Sphaerosporella brunnea TaxID=1250544 RepID=A0A5J5EYP3_9PEZI|nr:hypothetical protein FN846DRAFT_906932 [Sphaerosporella brunnea]
MSGTNFTFAYPDWDQTTEFHQPEPSSIHSILQAQYSDYHLLESNPQSGPQAQYNYPTFSLGIPEPLSMRMPTDSNEIHIPQSSFQQPQTPSISISRGQDGVPEPSALPVGSETPLRCTYQPCNAKDEDKVFRGQGARAAHKRHMDGHEKPHTCPYSHCQRNQIGNGFSRKDNLNVHIANQHGRAENRRRRVREHSDGLREKRTGGSLGCLLGGVTTGRIRRSVKNMSKRERVNLLKLILELMDDDSDDQEDDEEEDGKEDEEYY